MDANPARSAFAALCAGAVFAIAAVAIAVAAAAQPQTKPSAGQVHRPPLTNSLQALVVVTEDWGAVGGTLQRYERSTLRSPWQPIGKAFPVVVGKKGMAWGSGLQGEAAADPVKHEGDGKAPAGVFRLGAAFGQSASTMPALRLPYLPLSEKDGIECVDDPESSHYNRLVSKQDVEPDWKSSEKMWAEPLYEHGVVVRYNAPNPRPGAGSCIFLHIWKGAETGTAGCTAMPEADLTAVMKWLDSAKNPAIVQLPRGEYRRLRAEWRLP